MYSTNKKQILANVKNIYLSLKTIIKNWNFLSFMFIIKFNFDDIISLN